ncbi:hypothetical protein G4Y79_00590 [Phototrophicus methaneseepsis]|uniref:Uncharacterized protein n=1 Tax=Phototrophicus methaneseepsis TaxID=2710758 RepID=A0A7S8IET7_9CHLR|nr:hypothetical protein [Phototrophicus methaneseepsis]QPC82902.1 hypothetical protein G4Y79_00590 [Phototrophicus methaneseepsis]
MKKLMIFTTVFALLLASVAVTSAQDDTTPEPEDTPEATPDTTLPAMMFGGPGNGLMLQVMEITGLTLEDIQQGFANGQTLAELIEENGGDVDDVKQQLLDLGFGRYEAALSSRIDALMDHELGSRMWNNGRGLTLIQNVLDITGLTVEDIQQGIANGQTLAELIEENGGNVDTVRDELIAAAVEQFPNVDEDVIAARVDAVLEQDLGSHFQQRFPGLGGGMRNSRGNNRGGNRGFGPGPFGNGYGNNNMVPVTPEPTATADV